MRKVKVNLTKYVATEAGLRYCPAVITVGPNATRQFQRRSEAAVRCIANFLEGAKLS